MDKMGGMISCIIPMYNTELYIERCILSVLHQTYNNIEIIVVDDGSTDSSADIVKKLLPCGKIKLIKTTNGGVSSARNIGMRETTGDYLFFLDSDDMLPVNSFKILLAEMNKYSADLVIGREICFNEGESIPEDTYCGMVSLWQNDATLINALKDVPGTWNVCGKLFKKSFVSGLSFAEGKGIGEDSYFFFQCALKLPRTVYIEQNVYYCSLRLGSATRSIVSSKKIEDVLYFLERKKSDIDEQFVQFRPLVNNIEIKAHLAILSMLLRTDAYPQYEKKSIKVVREKRKFFIPGQSNDRLYYAVVYRYYWMYKRLYCFWKKYSK